MVNAVGKPMTLSSMWKAQDATKDLTALSIMLLGFLFPVSAAAVDLRPDFALMDGPHCHHSSSHVLSVCCSLTLCALCLLGT